ncbi:hypothetical protein AF72_00335 [Xylella taiwanensis]|uniref:Uncharacterized protein n=1 Tax=Xylella taiwanensis TaxID=1444770 RepID=Z9JNU7_9GAMM|nr:hypothetical protein AF72_00335 [Xylella taiwanensis]
MRATDLGAASSGWAWVLIRQYLHVNGIDNASLRSPLLDTDWLNTCVSMAFVGSCCSQWIGWSATWSNSCAESQSVWLSGCAQSQVTDEKTLA